MPQIDALNMLKWIHFILLSMAGGGAVVSLLLSGFETERQDLQGLAATVWKKTVTWGLRLALVTGIAMLGLKMSRGLHPFDQYYLHGKLLLVFLIMGTGEMAPKMLATGRRGAAMTTLFLFLLISFVVYNKELFGSKVRTRPAELPATAGTTFQAK